MEKHLIVIMPDESNWAVPVSIIARNRAEHYKAEFGNDLERSWREDTLPLFNSSDFEIEDWAENNMDWNDVKMYARKIEKGNQEIDYQDGWVNGGKYIKEL